MEKLGIRMRKDIEVDPIDRSRGDIAANDMGVDVPVTIATLNGAATSGDATVVNDAAVGRICWVTRLIETEMIRNLSPVVHASCGQVHTEGSDGVDVVSLSGEVTKVIHHHGNVSV